MKFHMAIPRLPSCIKPLHRTKWGIPTMSKVLSSAGCPEEESLTRDWHVWLLFVFFKTA